jgi:signal peptide peptidase SppA
MSDQIEVKTDEIRPRTYFPASLITTPWAITPEKLAVLQTVFLRYMRGEKLDAEEVQMIVHGAKRPAEQRAGAIAVLPLFGSIFPRANLMTNSSGATSADIFGNQFDELVKNPDISAIILDVDSPGGQVSGIPELSKKIYQARSQKPVVAVANYMMCSAAYWIGSAAQEVSITPSGDMGSIGVYAVHDDISEALKQGGINRTLISAGKYKTEGNPWAPLSEEAKGRIQADVDEIYDAFVADVARNRGVKAADVRIGFGEGRSVGARQAIDFGMADRIETLDQTIQRLQKSLFRLNDKQQQQAEELQLAVNQLRAKEK